MASSVAARELEKVLAPPKKEQLTVAKLADQLGVSRQAVHAWLKGDSKPRAEHMAKIETLTGVSMQDWFRDDPAPASTAEPEEGAKAS